MSGRRRLIVTNGDAAARTLRAAGLTDPILPWRDVLHDGPVPAGEASALRRVRAEFLAERFWGSFADLHGDLETRDATLERLDEHEEIVLAFEHDLYDQLQLVDVLSRLAALPAGGPSVTLALTTTYIGPMSPADARALLEARRSLRNAQADLAVAAWEAFTAPTPAALPDFLAAADLDPLPALGPALRRLLEERPDPRDGLARSERQALAAIAAGAATPGDAYRRSHHDREDPIWLGDASFAWYLERLSRVRVPLLTAEDGAPLVASGPDATPDFWHSPCTLTEAGRDVLHGRLSHAALNGLDRWQGGVHFVLEAA